MNSDDEMTDAEFIATVIKAREESVRFFESDSRPERELWVANEFLTNLGIQFELSELVHVTDDPPDVRFRDAHFEVKEIVDEGRRRHDEYKASLERARAANSVQDLVEPATPRDISYTDASDLVLARVKALSLKYAPSTRRQLDLLFYIDLEDVYGYIPTDLPTNESWLSYGFRSVSLLMGRLSGVLSTKDDAPEFLRSGGVRVVRAPSPSE